MEPDTVRLYEAYVARFGKLPVDPRGSGADQLAPVLQRALERGTPLRPEEYAAYLRPGDGR